MGYSTDFNGFFKMDKPLTAEQATYLKNFSGTRRMKRNVAELMRQFKGEHGKPDTTAIPAKLKPHVAALEAGGYKVALTKTKGGKRTAIEIYGIDGEFFARPDGQSGQSRDSSITDYNSPASTQPGLWCQWEVDGDKLKWDGGEKFYAYVEWLRYMIDNFFIPWGIILNGEVEWEGEDSSDLGMIVVKDNVVTTKTGSVVYH